MCTLTVVTRNDTYLMAMNRDEKIARGAGHSPEIHEFETPRPSIPATATVAHGLPPTNMESHSHC